MMRGRGLWEEQIQEVGSEQFCRKTFMLEKNPKGFQTKERTFAYVCLLAAKDLIQI